MKSLNKAFNSYISILGSHSTEDKLKFIQNVKELAKELLKLGNITGINYDEVTTGLSLDLLDRISKGGFTEGSFGKNSFKIYIEKSLIRFIKEQFEFESGFKDVIYDYDLIVNTAEDEEYPKLLDKFGYGRSLHKLLQIFFTKEEITLYSPLCMEIIHSGRDASNLSNDIKNFYDILVAGSRRVAYEEGIIFSGYSKKRLESAIKQALNSTLFLAAIDETKAVPKELLLSCDLDGLYTLARLAGGKEVKLPTVQDLDDLVNGVKKASSFIFNEDKTATNPKASKIAYAAIQSVKTRKNEKVFKSIVDLVNSSMEALPVLVQKIAEGSTRLDNKTLIKNYAVVTQKASKLVSTFLDNGR
jgi:hypothetical protein